MHSSKQTPPPPFRPLPSLAGTRAERKARTPQAAVIAIQLYGGNLMKRLAKKQARHHA